MKRNLLLFIFIISLIIDSTPVLASSPYGEMDVYYNGKLLPGKEIAKPVLKIGEPFTVGVNLTVYQKCYTSIMLSEIGDGDFVILEGSTSRMKEYRSDVMERNSTNTYEWTVAPTENWAGGALPVDLVYQINDFETGKILVNSGFTIAYPSISTEYYEGKIPSQESSSSYPETSSESTPAFTTFGTFLALALAASRH